jgi:hypothetical protein
MNGVPGVSEHQARRLLEKQIFSDVLTNQVDGD